MQLAVQAAAPAKGFGRGVGQGAGQHGNGQQPGADDAPGKEQVRRLAPGLTHQKSNTSFLAGEGTVSSKTCLLPLVVKRFLMPQKHSFTFDA